MGSKTPSGGYVRVTFKAKPKKDIPERVVQEVRAEAQRQPGFLGIEVTLEDGVEIAVSRWKSLADVQAWSQNPVHQGAKQNYAAYYEWHRLEVEQVKG